PPREGDRLGERKRQVGCRGSDLHGGGSERESHEGHSRSERTRARGGLPRASAILFIASTCRRSIAPNSARAASSAQGSGFLIIVQNTGNNLRPPTGAVSLPREAKRGDGVGPGRCPAAFLLPRALPRPIPCRLDLPIKSLISLVPGEGFEPP